MDNGPEERRRTASALSALSSTGSMGRPKAHSNVSDIMDLDPEAFVRQRSEARGSSMLDLAKYQLESGLVESGAESERSSRTCSKTGPDFLELLPAGGLTKGEPPSGAS